MLHLGGRGLALKEFFLQEGGVGLGLGGSQIKFSFNALGYMVGRWGVVGDYTFFF